MKKSWSKNLFFTLSVGVLMISYCPAAKAGDSWWDKVKSTTKDWACDVGADSYCNQMPNTNPQPPPGPSMDQTGNYQPPPNQYQDPPSAPAPTRIHDSGVTTVEVNGGSVPQVETETVDLPNQLIEEQPVPQAPQNIVLQPQPQAQPTSTPQSINTELGKTEYEACQDAVNKAVSDCSANGQATRIAAAAQAGAGAGMTGGAYSACKAMEAQSITALSGTAGVYEACSSVVSQCTSACKSTTDSIYKSRISSNLQKCQELSSQVKMGAMGALTQSVGGLTAAQQCNSLVKAQESGQCVGANANSYICNPMGYCNSNPSAPQCASLSAACNNPQTAANNPICAGANAGNSAFNDKLPEGDGMGGLEGQGSGFAGYDAKPHAQNAGSDSGSSSGGGGFGGNGGGYPGGAPSQGGSRGGSNPDTGSSQNGGSRASGTVALGNPTTDEDKPKRKRGYDDGGLDLSRFLPNGDLAGRNIASIDGSPLNYGITKANDLTNFQKITRMMNQKRKDLMP